MSELPDKKEVNVSDEAVKKATGKEWKEWFAILDAASAHKMTHKEIVEYLAKNHDAGAWWRQTITVQYEIVKGLRQKHQKTDGYQISKSKTIKAPAEKVFNAWNNKTIRAKWMKDPDIEITTSNKNKTIRAKWIDQKTTIEIYFYEKGEDKTQVVVQHNKINTASSAEKMKKYWEEEMLSFEKWINK